MMEQEVLDMTIEPPAVISDHSVVSWRLPYHQQHPIWPFRSSVKSGSGVNIIETSFDQHLSTLSCAASTVVQILWQKTSICNTRPTESGRPVCPGEESYHATSMSRADEFRDVPCHSRRLERRYQKSKPPGDSDPGRK